MQTTMLESMRTHPSCSDHQPWRKDSAKQAGCYGQSGKNNANGDGGKNTAWQLYEQDQDQVILMTITMRIHMTIQ